MFQGFSNQTIDFMWGIRFNNEKTWFEQHKEEYLQHLYNPFKELGRTVYEALAERHADLDLRHRVSRIYRDARRLHGNGPYKDHLWFSVEQPSEEWTIHPTFWFEYNPDGFTCGMGYYMPKALTMAKFRKRLDRDPKTFETLVRGFNKQNVFTLAGEDYKKPKGDAPSPLLAPWYNKKTFTLEHHGEVGGIAFTPALCDFLIEGYDALMPLYRYFVTLDSDADPREN